MAGRGKGFRDEFSKAVVPAERSLSCCVEEREEEEGRNPKIYRKRNLQDFMLVRSVHPSPNDIKLRT